jgi:hypothetical protein
MTLGAFRMFRAVLRERPDVAHFHDPELIPWGVLLRLHGIRVIYDVHEDLPNQLQHKEYISLPIARVLALVVGMVEWVASKLLTHVIIVVPSMLNRFEGENVTVVANFPLLSEFIDGPLEETNSNNASFVYAGGISRVRGINEMVEAINLLGDNRASLRLMGRFTEPGLEAEIGNQAGWEQVKYLGWCSRKTISKELSEASAGLVLLHPTPQYRISYPVKMFEYMAAGIPVIGSDFPLWRKIVDGAGCGMVVNPRDPQEIADAMQWILDHPVEARQMGNRGRLAVETNYNWEAESKKLLEVYRQILL